MASESTNEAVAVLRRRFAAATSAVQAAGAAALAVGGAEQRRQAAAERWEARRAVGMRRWDDAVSAAGAEQDVALAVLAGVVSVGEAARFAGVAVVRVREAQRRADPAVVAARMKDLLGEETARRRPGRPRKSESGVSSVDG